MPDCRYSSTKVRRSPLRGACRARGSRRGTAGAACALGRRFCAPLRVCIGCAAPAPLLSRLRAPPARAAPAPPARRRLRARGRNDRRLLRLCRGDCPLQIVTLALVPARARPAPSALAPHRPPSRACALCRASRTAAAPAGGAHQPNGRSEEFHAASAAVASRRATAHAVGFASAARRARPRLCSLHARRDARCRRKTPALHNCCFLANLIFPPPGAHRRRTHQPP